MSRQEVHQVYASLDLSGPFVEMLRLPGPGSTQTKQQMLEHFYAYNYPPYVRTWVEQHQDALRAAFTLGGGLDAVFKVVQAYAEQERT